jgi:hypothetical protein
LLGKLYMSAVLMVAGGVGAASGCGELSRRERLLEGERAAVELGFCWAVKDSFCWVVRECFRFSAPASAEDIGRVGSGEEGCCDAELAG